MLGLGNKVGLEYYGLSSFLVKYDEQLHYPTYIQFNRITGTNYTVYISIEALGEPLPPTGEPDNGNTPEPPAGEPNNGNTPEPPTEEPDNGNTPPPAGEPDNEFWEIIIGGPKTVW
jgi:hypothetical protein